MSVWSKMTFFRWLGVLEGTFVRTHEPRLFVMHSGSVLSGSDAGNANNDLKMSILPICRVGNVYVHSVKRIVFLVFGGLGGDICKDTYEAKLFGMHSGRFFVMWTSDGSQPFRRYTIPNLCFGSKMCVWSKMTFIRWLEVFGGDFYQGIH